MHLTAWKPESRHKQKKMLITACNLFCIEQAESYNVDEPVSKCGMMITSNLVMNNLI